MTQAQGAGGRGNAVGRASARIWFVPSLVATAAAVAPLILDNQFYILLLELAGIYYIAALGLNLVLGYAGQVSLGHAALFGAGAYASAILTLKLGQPFGVGLVGAAAFAGLVGLLLGVPSLRMAGPYLAMATMAFNLIVQKLTINWAELTGGPDGLPGIPPAALGPLVFDRRTHLYLVLALALLAYVLTRNLVASRYGRSWMAMRDDEVAASSMGMDLYGNKLLVFALSAVYAGLAGSLFAHLYRHISPISFGLEASIDLLLIVILGGIGTVGWPLAGAVLLTALPQLPALQNLQDARLLFYGGILLLAVLAFRQGLAGLFAPPSPSPAFPHAVHSKLVEGPEPVEGRVPLSHSRPTLLSVAGLTVRYGGAEAVSDLDLDVGAGEIVALIGSNGAGKSSTLRAISGLVPVASGQIVFDELPRQRLSTSDIVGLGVVHVPEGRLVFGDQTVEDNLRLGAYLRHFRPGRATIRQDVEALLERFPALAQRRAQLAATLSGGEQQMLAIARALMARPRLLLLDEPSLGLAPRLVEQVFQIVAELRDQGVTILLVEQLASRALEIADRAYVLEAGRCVLSGPADEVAQHPDVMRAYLGVGSG